MMKRMVDNVSSRCKACNKVLEVHELRINGDTNELEDMCSRCLSIVYMYEDFSTDDSSDDIGVAGIEIDSSDENIY